MDDYRFMGMATRSTFSLRYQPADAGKTAHIVLAWYNRKGQRGPISAPVQAAVAA